MIRIAQRALVGNGSIHMDYHDYDAIEDGFIRLIGKLGACRSKRNYAASAVMWFDSLTDEDRMKYIEDYRKSSREFKRPRKTIATHEWVAKLVTWQYRRVKAIELVTAMLLGFSALSDAESLKWVAIAEARPKVHK